MKYIALTGGLGNQLFIYAFCLELRAKGVKAVLFVPRIKDSKGYGHQGYELDKLFHIQRFDGWYSKPLSLLLQLYSQFIRVFPAKWKPCLFQLIGIRIIKVPENFIYYPEIFDFKLKNELFMGTWQSEIFFKDVESIVRSTYIFTESLLSIQTLKIASLIQSQNSISIHIRRGDYLSDQYNNGFVGVCTEEYYSKAIDYIKRQVKTPLFYIFTDDKEWVNENFKLENAVYINHNSGKDSWEDMYLMSQCKHNIIANSSFSWWGAWLNSNPDKIVIAPKLWWRLFKKDDVVPNDWIRL